MEIDDNMEAIVLLSSEIEVQKIEKVKTIRVNDELYNLFIAKDYWPVIGEINGNISIEADKTYNFQDISGFYILSHNVFKLIIKEKG